LLINLSSFLVLQTLVTQSLTEDALGTIQRDIPKVLESLCGYLAVVEGAREELGKKVGLDVREGGGVGGGWDDEKKEEILRGLTEIEPLRAGESPSSILNLYTGIIWEWYSSRKCCGRHYINFRSAVERI